MTLLSRKQEMLLTIAASGPCTYEMLERELVMPRSTVTEKLLWLQSDKAIERTKVGRTWQFKATKFGREVAAALKAVRKLEAGC